MLQVPNEHRRVPGFWNTSWGKNLFVKVGEICYQKTQNWKNFALPKSKTCSGSVDFWCHGLAAHGSNVYRMAMTAFLQHVLWCRSPKKTSILLFILEKVQPESRTEISMHHLAFLSNAHMYLSWNSRHARQNLACRSSCRINRINMITRKLPRRFARAFLTQPKIKCSS